MKTEGNITETKHFKRLKESEFNNIKNYINKHEYEFKTLFKKCTDELNCIITDKWVYLDGNQYNDYLQVKNYIDMEAARKKAVREIRMMANNYEPRKIHDDMEE